MKAIKKTIIAIASLLSSCAPALAQNTTTPPAGMLKYTPQFWYKPSTPDSLNMDWEFNPNTNKWNRKYSATEVSKLYFKKTDTASTVQTISNLYPKTDIRYYTKTASDATFAKLTGANFTGAVNATDIAGSSSVSGPLGVFNTIKIINGTIGNTTSGAVQLAWQDRVTTGVPSYKWKTMIGGNPVTGPSTFDVLYNSTLALSITEAGVVNDGAGHRFITTVDGGAKADTGSVVKKSGDTMTGALINNESVSVGTIGYTKVYTSPNVSAHQGVQFHGAYAYIFATSRIDKVDTTTYAVVSSNTTPLSGVTGTSHLGPPAYYNNLLYAPADVYVGCGTSSNERLAIYNLSDLSLNRVVDLSSYHMNVTGAIAIDSANNKYYLGSYCDGSVKRFNLATDAYIDSINVGVLGIQGMRITGNTLYISSGNGIYTCNKNDGSNLTLVYAVSPSDMVVEGMDILNGQIRLLEDFSNAGTNSSIVYLNPTTVPAAFNADKSGDVAVGSDLRVGGVAIFTNPISVGTTTNTAPFNGSSGDTRKVILEHFGTNNRTYVSSNASSSIFSQNMYVNGATPFDITQPSYALQFNASTGVIQLRTAAAGSSTFTTPFSITTAGVTSFAGNVLPEANNTRSLGSSLFKWADFYSALATITTLSATTGTYSSSLSLAGNTTSETALSITNAGAGDSGINFSAGTGKRTVQRMQVAGVNKWGFFVNDPIVGANSFGLYDYAKSGFIMGALPNGNLYFNPTGTFSILSMATAGIVTNNTSGNLISTTVLPATTTATTQTALDNSAKLATTAYVDALKSATATLTNKTITSPIINGTATLVNYYSTSATPTITVGAAAGTGATASIVGNNQNGVITLNTGTGTTSGAAVFTVTMSGGFAYPTACTPQLNAILFGSQAWGAAIGTTTATTFSMDVAGAMPASTTYKWTYHNGGY